MTDDLNNPVLQRCAAVEAEGKALYGEHAWEVAMKGQAARLQNGEITQGDILRATEQPNAASVLFYDGMSHAPPEEFGDWRAKGAHRKARIARAGG